MGCMCVSRYDFSLLLLKEIQLESLLQFTLYLGGHGWLTWGEEIFVFLDHLEKKAAWHLEILDDSTLNSSERITKRA